MIFYVLVIAVFGSLLWLVFNQGSKLDGPQSTPMRAESPPVEVSAEVAFISSLSKNLEDPLSLLLIQMVVIIFSSKLLAV